MKISGSTPNYINQTYSNQANAATNVKTEKSLEETKGDSLNLSPKTRDLQRISAALDVEPADRTKLVADLKQQVQANQYNVNAEQVAAKMIGSLMDKHG